MTHLWFLVVCLLFCGCRIAQTQDDDSETMSSQYADKFRRAFRAANISEDTVVRSTSSVATGANFDCDLPTIDPPRNVHELSPPHVEVVAAMGDSVTAAFGAGARNIVEDFIEYRGLSWSIGGDSDLTEVLTLPNLIKKFNPDVDGYSIKTGTRSSPNSGLNVAVSGAVAKGMIGQAEYLVGKINELGYQDKWKVVTMWIGGNDLCAHCSGEAEDHANAYVSRLEEALDYLKANLRNTFVNMVKIIDVTKLMELNYLDCRLLHVVACRCGTMDSTKDLVSRSATLYNEKLDELIGSGKYDSADRGDFTVVLQPFFSLTEVPYKDGKPDRSYFAPDCFHFSRIGHEVGGHYLWNNMFEPVGQKTDQVDWFSEEPLKCPSAPYYFYTSKNSLGAGLLNTNIKGGNQQQQHPSFSNSSLLVIILGTIGCVVLAAIATMTVVVVVIKRRRRQRSPITNTEGRSQTEKTQLLVFKQ